jgi:fatty-acyl-CoA synthase
LVADRWWLGTALRAYAGDPRPAHTYLRADGTARRLTRAVLHDEVVSRAAALRELGVGAGDRVAIVADEAEWFVPTFLASLWLAAVAVPLAAPPPIGRRDVWSAALGEALTKVRPKLVCARAGARGDWPGVVVVDVTPSGGRTALVEAASRAPAYAQFTSGSTGRPRAVMVTRGSLAANCEAIVRGLSLDGDRDVGVCWLPLHHDMGLVGFVCAPLLAGLPVVFLPTSAFVRDPGAWMRTMAAHRGTVTYGPTFAYGLAARRARDIDGLDLSRVRVLGCGAEPVHAPTLLRFAEAYGAAGLRPEAFTPSYGLAEATLAVSMAHGLRTHNGVVDCGRTVPGQEVSIVDGEIWVRGASVAAGYLDEPAPDTFRPDGWLRTGDLGYLHDGGLHVTGRRKDVLIVRGANTDPQHVEWAAATVPGVRESGVVAFTRPGADTEEVVLVVECPLNAPSTVEDQVRAAVLEPLGLSVSDVVRVRPGTIPKTTSGKPRRQETRRRYLAGELTR